MARTPTIAGAPEPVAALASSVVEEPAPTIDVAPQPGETTQFNRLTITIQIEFINNTDPEQNWKQSFNWFSDYDANENLPNVQDDLHEEIITELVENVFNKAFTNW